MLDDGSTADNNFNGFIQRTIKNKKLFHLSNGDGIANSVSNGTEEMVILLFWSDRSSAAVISGLMGNNFAETEIGLFSFLYQWLPKMSRDGVLAGPNWSSDDTGSELDPFDLRETIESQMPSSLLEEYRVKYNRITQNNAIRRTRTLNT